MPLAVAMPFCLSGRRQTERQTDRERDRAENSAIDIKLHTWISYRVCIS